jgi:sugar-specific transcriptional regulator TrmB|tara:strand:+ start:894 stop:1649 length:756 start_codon:yes stop_codon:yes gene_type:complete
MLNVLTELQNLGLSDKEAGIYFAALEMGQATADQLAKHSKVKRSTAYAYIESLMNKGLMSSFESGRKTYFTPESPKNIERLFDVERKNLDKRKENLQEVLPDLTQLFDAAGERPEVRFFTGKEGIITIREEILSCKGKNISVLFALDAFFALFSDEERSNYTHSRIKKGIRTRLIYSRKDGPIKKSPTQYTERKYMGSDRFIGADIAIYDDKVALMSLRGKIFGVVIKSREVSKSLLAMFDLIWETRTSDK